MPGENKWSFYNSIHGANYEVPFPLPVEKVEGFTYWPLMGTEKGTDEEQKMWETFLTPDITETSLEKIFTKPGETAIYQYHLVDGFRSRCKVTYHGKMLVRTRGKTRWLPSKEQLVRDPEYERDVQRVRRISRGSFTALHCQTNHPSWLGTSLPSSHAVSVRRELQNFATLGCTLVLNHWRILM